VSRRGFRLHAVLDFHRNGRCRQMPHRQSGARTGRPGYRCRRSAALRSTRHVSSCFLRHTYSTTSLAKEKTCQSPEKTMAAAIPKVDEMGARASSWLIFVAILSHAAPLLAQSGAGLGYHKTREIVLGGNGGWDYLTFDTVARRLYIARSTEVLIVDPDAGRAIGRIPDTPGVHGIALARELGTGYTSNGRDGTITVFDMATLRQRARISVGTNPDAIVYEPTTKRVFAFNGGSHDASVLDAQTGAVLATLPLDGKPEFAVADGHGAI